MALKVQPLYPKAGQLISERALRMILLSQVHLTKSICTYKIMLASLLKIYSLLMDRLMHKFILKEWSQNICAWGLGGIVATLLDSLGPLRLVGAQFLYFSQPVASIFISDHRLSVLIDLFEDQKQAQVFISYLRDGVQQ